MNDLIIKPEINIVHPNATIRPGRIYVMRDGTKYIADEHGALHRLTPKKHKKEKQNEKR
jgi:hypothetical protein